MPQIMKIRDMKSTVLGRLMSIHGTVTRTTEVKPELNIGSFKCLECNSIYPSMEQQFKYTEPVRCVNERCMNKSKWELINSDSIFMDWQKLRV
jgi:DNA replication licensing factor MCM6